MQYTNINWTDVASVQDKDTCYKETHGDLWIGAVFICLPISVILILSGILMKAWGIGPSDYVRTYIRFAVFSPAILIPILYLLGWMYANHEMKQMEYTTKKACDAGYALAILMQDKVLAEKFEKIRDLDMIISSPIPIFKIYDRMAEEANKGHLSEETCVLYNKVREVIVN